MLMSLRVSNIATSRNTTSETEEGRSAFTVGTPAAESQLTWWLLIEPRLVLQRQDWGRLALLHCPDAALDLLQE